MARLTDDPKDPDLKRGVDTDVSPQNDAYLVLKQEELEKGFVRPVRLDYIHSVCRTRTSMPLKIAQTYARDPKFYGATYCCYCQKHLSVSEFLWEDGSVVGS